MAFVACAIRLPGLPHLARAQRRRGVLFVRCFVSCAIVGKEQFRPGWCVFSINTPAVYLCKSYDSCQATVANSLSFAVDNLIYLVVFRAQK